MGENAGTIKKEIERAESFIESNDHQNAIELILDIINAFDDIGDFENRDKFLVKLTKCYKVIAKEFREQKDYFEAAETYCSAAFHQKEHNKNEVASQLFDQAIECFACAGKVALSNETYKDASMLYSSAAKYARTELNDKTLSNKYDKNALEALQAEIKSQLDHDDPYIECRNQLDLGKIYAYLEDYEKALKQFQKVVEISISHNLFSLTAESFQQMAASYEALGNESAMTDCLSSAVHYRLKEGEQYCEKDLPLEAVQNYIEAAHCVSYLEDSNQLLKDILESEANCFLSAAKWNAANGQVLQAAYFERNAAHCYNQIGNPEASIDLFLTAAEKLLSLKDYFGAAHNFQDASLYQEQVGEYVKAANLAVEAANSAKQSGEIEFAIENFTRAVLIYQSIGYIEKAKSSSLELAECFIQLAEANLPSEKFHPTAFSYYQAADFYYKSGNIELAKEVYNKAIHYYKRAIDLAIKDEEMVLASYSACCATLVCLILQEPRRAESILKNIQEHSSNSYYILSNSIIKAYKTKNRDDYLEICERFFKIIQSSLEIKNMLEITAQSL